MSGEEAVQSGALLSIGALSRATGVSVDTLRTWERRYGVPTPLRTASGHRRYRLSTVELVRKVRLAIDRGHRASVALTCSAEDLEALLRLPDTGLAAGQTADPDPSRIRLWMAELERMDGSALDHGFHTAYKTYGPEVFVLELAIPFMREVGTRWAKGELSVAHEHFASGRLEDFLIQRWRPQSELARGASILLATIPVEEHSLPLHLAAVLIVQDGFRPWVFPPGTTTAQLVQAAEQLGAQAVVMSVINAEHEAAAAENLQALRSQLKPSIPVLAGGALRAFPPGITEIPELGALRACLLEINLRRGA